MTKEDLGGRGGGDLAYFVDQKISRPTLGTESMLYLALETQQSISSPQRMGTRDGCPHICI